MNENDAKPVTHVSIPIETVNQALGALSTHPAVEAFLKFKIAADESFKQQTEAAADPPAKTGTP